MKQPAFRLEPVLKLRRTEERAAALASAQAAREATEAAERAERDAAALTERALPGHPTGSAFIAAMVASAAAAADVSAARALAVARAEQADLVRARWTAAAQRTKGLERLRERHVAALQAAADAAEERVVDDLVTRQHSTTRASTDEMSREETTWTD
ncbi:flagellar export protein FliJ [Modestobacter sp. VKM Ac-2985]|uniref:flagellar export protein FliJ n=1 Tax=Modestobacter sp. VKM Ac-2985 TaxID=3004139 RepID=UPI0022AB9460|nr:flagellar export protein FliJ [Modestobacter sp. VKM Ac-2985]MCZ2836507.1 flagellar export protein FliJ [Modestobacter sp. VKM Ac-2985]